MASIITGKQKISFYQNMIPGVNIIVHNLGLSDPLSFNMKAMQSDGNIINISNFQNCTSNSFEFKSAIGISNVHFTIS